MGNFSGCGKIGHMKRDCPKMKSQGRENYKAQESSPNPDDPKKNFIYVIHCSVDQEESPDVVNDILQFFSINMYDLSFGTTLVARKFNMIPDVPIEPFFKTPMGVSIMARIVIRSCPILFPNRISFG